MKSFLYLIYSEIGFMIGKSSDVYRRFAVIEGHSPIELTLFRVYKIEKNGIHEKRLQKQYEMKRIRGGWFALDFYDIKEIDKYLLRNKGTRILDNLKKIKNDLTESSLDSALDPNQDLYEGIKKVEDTVEKLKGALSGRPNLK